MTTEHRHVITRFQATATLILLLLASACLAQDAWPDSLRFGLAKAKEIAAAPTVIAAVEEQNRLNHQLDPAEKQALDERWRAQYGKSNADLITLMMETPLSDFLRTLHLREKGVITEIIVMDNQGLNAGQSAITTDLWQGDEPKWVKTFLAGPGAYYASPVRHDDSTGVWQIQVSYTISNDAGNAIGAVTVGVALSEFGE